MVGQWVLAELRRHGMTSVRARSTRCSSAWRATAGCAARSRAAGARARRFYHLTPRGREVLALVRGAVGELHDEVRHPPRSGPRGRGAAPREGRHDDGRRGRRPGDAARRDRAPLPASRNDRLRWARSAHRDDGGRGRAAEALADAGGVSRLSRRHAVHPRAQLHRARHPHRSRARRLARPRRRRRVVHPAGHVHRGHPVLGVPPTAPCRRPRRCSTASSPS